MTFYVWDNQDKQLSGSWPGKRVSTTKTIDGQRWYYQSYRLTTPGQYINRVVSNSVGKQTVDITGLKTDSYLCINGTQEDGKYTVDDFTAETVTSLVKNSQLKPLLLGGGWEEANSPFIYDLSGKPLSHPSRGIQIINHRKVLAK